MRLFIVLISGLGLLLVQGIFAAELLPQARPVSLVENGIAKLPIIAGSVAEPVTLLETYLTRMSGATFQRATAAPGVRGIYVGLPADFPGFELPNLEGMSEEAIYVYSDGANLYLLGGGPLGVRHAVTTFLTELGCRWFFPGKTWEVVPLQATIQGTWAIKHTPSYHTYRKISLGFGAYPRTGREFDAWNQANRMGGPEPISTGHTWYGIDPEKDFAVHPEWFALDDGKRTKAKPCYSNPEVVQQMITHARAQAAAGSRSISLSAPDGLGYCTCPRCFAVFQGTEPYAAHSSWFAKRADGEIVNVTSETLFAAANAVANALEADYPNVIIGVYGYSAYSHPPSFPLHRNVYVCIATSYRRTPLSLEEQLKAWGKRSQRVGIRDYWSVYQWDWDNPQPGPMHPFRLRQALRGYAENNASALITEASNNWGARGLGYYVGAKLLWDLDADVPGLIADFYRTAFGQAAYPVQRYYTRWYGPELAVLPDTKDTPESGVWQQKELVESRRTLHGAFADLDQAYQLVKDTPGPRERVDALRMYAYYLYLRWQQWDASAKKQPEAIMAAIRAETAFGAQLTYTNMIHSRPLLGKAFERRFRSNADMLAKMEDAGKDSPWRQPAEAPTAEAFAALWAAAFVDLNRE